MIPSTGSRISSLWLLEKAALANPPLQVIDFDKFRAHNVLSALFIDISI